MKASTAENEVRAILESWAKSTKESRNDDILKNHSEDLVIFDVLPPMKYESAAAYRRSWEDWHPETEAGAIFDLENLSITAGADIAFAHSFINCGGTLPDGKSFRDTVRATFCLERVNGVWVVKHQHISKPQES